MVVNIHQLLSPWIKLLVWLRYDSQRKVQSVRQSNCWLHLLGSAKQMNEWMNECVVMVRTKSIKSIGGFGHPTLLMWFGPLIFFYFTSNLCTIFLILSQILQYLHTFLLFKHMCLSLYHKIILINWNFLKVFVMTPKKKTKRLKT